MSFNYSQLEDEKHEKKILKYIEEVMNVKEVDSQNIEKKQNIFISKINRKDVDYDCFFVANTNTISFLEKLKNSVVANFFDFYPRTITEYSEVETLQKNENLIGGFVKIMKINKNQKKVVIKQVVLETKYEAIENEVKYINIFKYL